MTAAAAVAACLLLCRKCVAVGQLAVLCCLLITTACAQPLGKPSAPTLGAAPAATTTPAAAAPAGAGLRAAECSLYLLGGKSGIDRAGMRCNGPQPKIALGSQHLAAHKHNFSGITFTSSCSGSSFNTSVCLMTVCSGSLGLKNSTVSWVRGIPAIRGVVCVVGNSSVEVRNSTFSLNHYTPLSVWDNARLVLSRSTVNNNVVNVSGGGIMAGNMSAVVVVESRVHGNTANISGGGMLVVDAASVTLTHSSVYNNTAGEVGGGLFVLGNGNVSLGTGSSVHRNIASWGGGVCVQGGAGVVIVGGSRVHGNNAIKFGGGMLVGGAARVTVTNCSVHNNTAGGSGGGMAVVENAHVVLVGSAIDNNNASHGGGGVTVAGNSRVTVTNCSVHNNTAGGSGGGMAVVENAHVVLVGSAIDNNNASHGGGGVTVAGNSTMIFNASFVHSNVARSGGGMAVVANASVLITDDSVVYNNTVGESGGGLAVMENATVTLTGGSSVYVNNASVGGGLAVDALLMHYKYGNATVMLTGSSSVHSNMAVSGGGLDVASNASVVITDSSTVHSNVVRAHRRSGGSGGGLNVRAGARVNISRRSIIANNTCHGVGGGIAVGDPVGTSSTFDARGRYVGEKRSYVTIDNSTVANNTSIDTAGGGMAVRGNGSVELVNGTMFLANSAVNSSAGGVLLLGSGAVRADSSVMFVRNFVSIGYVGRDIAAFDNSLLGLPLRGELTKCSTGVYLGRAVCEADEVQQVDRCVCGCPQHMFSFTNATEASLCEPCPRNANCSGGSLVKPLPGYWASARTSVQMHRCPLSDTACNYSGPTRECAEGYTGPLCGTCQRLLYGLLSPFRCGRCLPPKVQLVLFLLVSLVGVVFVAITVHATWQDNLLGNTAVLATDLIKVLVQYLQYTSIIGSVSVPWPLFDFQRWFQAINVVFAVASSQVLSLDCWLYHYIPQGTFPIAMQRQLVYFIAPVLVFLAVLALQWLVWALMRWLVPLVWGPKEGATPRPASVWRKLPVTMLVSAYYAYPTLIRAPLSFFACLRIDRLAPEVYLPPGATAPLNHTMGYWVSSPDQACFAGYHKAWALGLGLPSILLWCVAVPVAMGLGLFLCRAKADEDSFREHFGFLYRNYRPERIWWEAVWAARTVVLTLISVFAFPMERYSSVLSLLVVFWASAALQNVFQPYAFPTLHRMHMVSTSCLAATTVGALAMFAYDIQEGTALRLRIAIMVLVMLVNVGFVAWCLWNLVPAVKEWCVTAYKLAVSWVSWVVDAVLACAGRSKAGQGRGRGRRGGTRGTAV